jgi:hypothetical protein
VKSFSKVRATLRKEFGHEAAEKLFNDLSGLAGERSDPSGWSEVRCFLGDKPELVGSDIVGIPCYAELTSQGSVPTVRSVYVAKEHGGDDGSSVVEWTFLRSVNLVSRRSPTVGKPILSL